MALEVGSRLAHYDVTALIGEGGMGQVYRATDTQLGRDVALKILPDAFAADPDRLARFQREAQVLASLNHPNIAQIHGIEKSDDTQALVLELVEGPTLADRIATGPIPLDEALPIAKQIAEALEAAHEAGVIHRDLKPANIKVREDGTVKVLDFGLAKAFDPTPAGDPSQSPTLTAAATQMGVILGTAAYMSPEQARGKPVDKRADIWAFGAVLFEMLTGTKPFPGDDASQTLARVIDRAPDWGSFPGTLPRGLDTFVRRCLEKDPRQRLRDIGDVRLAMEGAFETSAASPSQQSVARKGHVAGRLVLAAVVGLALIVFGGFAAVSLLRLGPATRPLPTRFLVTVPASVTVGTQGIAISPDGRTVVFHASSPETGVQLYRRSLDEIRAVPIPGTDDGQLPFFSPDGAWVGFFVTGELRKVSLDGRPPVTLCAVPGNRRGASWGTDDAIWFSYDGSNGLWRVPATGGEAEPVESAESDADLHWMDVLPNGEAALVTLWSGALSTAQIAVQSFETGELEILLAGTNPRYSSTGHIVFARQEALWAVPFDAARRSTTGPAAPVLGDLRVNAGGLAQFSLAENGTLVYWAGSASGRTLVWVDRDGHEEPVGAPARTHYTPRISPDGTLIATYVAEEEQDIWTYDVARGTSQRLTYHPAEDRDPVWTRDGTKLAFLSTGRDGGDGIFLTASDGTGEAERLSTGHHRPDSLLPDGTHVLFSDDADVGGDIGWLSLDSDPNPQILLASPFIERNAVVSPDGRWMAIAANTTGRSEVVVRPFPNVDEGQWQISTNGGSEPRWSPDGRELFYRVGSAMMAVPVVDGPPPTWGSPAFLFEGPYEVTFFYSTMYDVAPDGQRFVMIKPGTDMASASPGSDLVVVEHWSEELNGLVSVE